MLKFNSDDIVDKTFLRLLITSLISIVLCIACFTGTTFAYYTDSVASDHNVTGSASYVGTVASENGTAYTAAADGSYTLSRGDIIVLSASGTASAGYVVVTVGDVSYYGTLIPGHQLALTVDSADTVKFTVDFNWGSYDVTVKTALGSTI